MDNRPARGRFDVFDLVRVDFDTVAIGERQKDHMAVFKRLWFNLKPLSGLLGRQVRAEILVHLEHACRLLAKNLRMLVVGVDLASILGILQVVLLDIFPDLTNHLATRQIVLTDDLGQIGRRGHRRGYAPRAPPVGLSVALTFFTAAAVSSLPRFSADRAIVSSSPIWA